VQSCRVTSNFDNITTQKELKKKWKRKNKYTALLASRTALQERINSIEYSIETTHQVRHIDIMTIATDWHQQKNTTGKHESPINGVQGRVDVIKIYYKTCIHGAKHSNRDMRWLVISTRKLVSCSTTKLVSCSETSFMFE